MVAENVSKKFRMKNIGKTRIFFFQEIEQIELMSRNWTLSYFSFYKYWMYFNFYFCFFACYLDKNYELCNGIKIYAIDAVIKKCKQIIKKKKRNMIK